MLGFADTPMEKPMRNQRAPVMIAIAALLSACSSSAPADQSASIANSCIKPTEITKQAIVSDQEIQFTLRNGEVWSNKLAHTCPGLKFDQGFTWEVSGNLVCSNQQTIRVKDSGTPCQLGEFSKLPEPPKT